MNWLQSTVGDVCERTDQTNPATSNRKSFRYIDISGIDRDAKVVARAESIPCVDAPSRARKQVRAGDVLVSTVRPNLNAVAVVPTELDGEIASTGFAVLRARRKIAEPRYVFYHTQQSQFVDYLVANATGASYPAVSDAIVKRVTLPLPPPSEQRRIIEILDQADDLRKRARDADAKAARILPALFLKMFGDPATNPMGWPVKPLSKAIDHIEAGWSARGEMRARRPGEFGVLKVSAVTSGTFLPEEYKTVPSVPSSQALVTPKRGDLLFSRANTRELVAATCLVDADYQYLFLPDKLWRLVPRENIATTPYLRELMAGEVVRDKFRASSSGSSGSMLNVSQAAVLRTEVPLAPHDLQITFERHTWKVLALLRAIHQVRIRLDTLRETLIQRAFSGQLTAKWREAHMQELLDEMQEQARLLNLPAPITVPG